MTFEVRVSGSAPAAAAPAAGHADTSLDDSAKLDPNATPPAAWQPYDPRLAPAPGGREHKLTLTATEGVVEVAPGVKQQMWSFQG
jgi:nitrite reductase (NO-forming)